MLEIISIQMAEEDSQGHHRHLAQTASPLEAVAARALLEAAAIVVLLAGLAAAALGDGGLVSWMEASHSWIQLARDRCGQQDHRC